MKKAAILIILVLASCSLTNKLKNKYFTNIPFTDIKDLRQNPEFIIDSILLDNSYELYVRQICRDAPPHDYYNSNNPNLTASVQRCNCEEMQVPRDKKERQELQYLLVSNAKKKFILMTVVPPGVTTGPNGLASYYDQPLFDHDSLININYLNNFYFGTIDGQSFITNRGTKIMAGKWDINIAPEQFIDIQHLKYQDGTEQHDSELADAFPIKTRFYFKTHWRMILNNCPWDTVIDPNDNNYLENNTIFIISSKAKPGVVQHIWFHFNEQYNIETDPQKKLFDLFFESGRVKSSPYDKNNRFNW